MTEKNISLTKQVVALCVAAVVFAYVLGKSEQPITSEATVSQVSAVSVFSATSTIESESELQSEAAEEIQETDTLSQVISATSVEISAPVQEPPIVPQDQKEPHTAYRIESPYDTPPIPFETINKMARAALVNILCLPQSSSLRPITGSGVIVSPQGVILTNAHVAQYVLLSEATNVSITCTIRAGDPATPRWIPQVLYVPPVWIQSHAADIKSTRPLGTGEHDYALIFIAGSLNGSSLPASFPYIPIDTREAIGFIDDEVLVASYPAEFLGGLAALNSLYAASSITTIKQLLTFGTNTPDVQSLGGVIGAQSGSSGGAVVNAWGKIIGIISTMSEGSTTSERDLRAVALSYINRDIRAQTGSDLDTILTGDAAQHTKTFTQETAVGLIKILIDAL